MTATENYRKALETGDVELAISTFAEDAVLRSPITGNARFTGHDQLRPLLAAAFARITGIRCHTDAGDEHTRVVVYTGRVGGEDIEESALLRLNERGLITEATLFVRPLPGLVGLMSAIGPQLAAGDGKPVIARLLSVAIKPLLAMVRAGDRLAVRTLS